MDVCVGGVRVFLLSVLCVFVCVLCTYACMRATQAGLEYSTTLTRDYLYLSVYYRRECLELWFMRLVTLVDNSGERIGQPREVLSRSVSRLYFLHFFTRGTTNNGESRS